MFRIVLVLIYITTSRVSASSNISLSMPQLLEPQVNGPTKLYKYNHTGNNITIRCVCNNPTLAKGYKVRIYLDHNQRTGIKVTGFEGYAKATLTPSERSKKIICTAIYGTNEEPILRNEVSLRYVPSISLPTISITGPPKLQKQYFDDNIDLMHFTDGDNVTLNCALEYPEGSQVYDLAFYLGDDAKRLTKIEGLKSSSRITHTFILKKENKIIRCEAQPSGLGEAKNLTSIVHLQYSPSPSPYQSASGSHQHWAIKVLEGCAVVLVACLLLCFALLLHRRKKPLSVEPNYANMTQDLNYRTMPTPEPGTLPIANSWKTLETVVENPYCEILEPPYADPNRFISDLPYAVPYDRSNYTEPYAPRSDGPYILPYAPKANTLRPILPHSGALGNKSSSTLPNMPRL